MPSMPGNTADSQPFPPSSAQATVSHHFAWVRCLSNPKHLGDAQWPAWLTTCYQLTPYLQRFRPVSALLDLGPCTGTEAGAVAVAQALITRLATQQISLHAAIAPSGVFAQFAMYHLLHTPVSSQTPVAILTPEQTTDLLRKLPITALTRLQFADPTTITTRMLTQAVSWLENYGVRTIAHLTRLEDDFLRRQFGARRDMLLATVARGDDPLPLPPLVYCSTWFPAPSYMNQVWLMNCWPFCASYQYFRRRSAS